MVHIYIYIYTCISRYVYVCIHMYIQMCTYVLHICIDIYIYIYIYICIYMYTHRCYNTHNISAAATCDAPAPGPPGIYRIY